MPEAPSPKGTLNARDWKHHIIDTLLVCASVAIPFISAHVIPDLHLDPKTEGAAAFVLAQAALLVRRAMTDGGIAAPEEAKTEKFDRRNP